MTHAINYKKLSLGFFALYLVIGVFIYKDYGYAWDDDASRYNGTTNWDYIFNNDQALLNSSERYHGPALEILLVGVEKLFHLSDSRDILLAHHLSDFLFFYFSAIVFFFSARRLLGDDKWALIATLMLVLSPRIFGDSFFNSKDIGFLSALIFAFYPLLRIMEKPDWKWLMVHCLACGFAIDIRILGFVLVPVAVAILLKGLIESQLSKKEYLLLFILYPFLLFGFVVAFWPILWKAPGYHLEQAFLQMKSYPWPYTMLYEGKQIGVSELPWHYIPVWIFISTPVLFSLLWLAGAVIILKRAISRPLLFLKENLVWGCVLFLSIGPLLAIICLKSAVYDGWRHVFFVYPFFVLVAAYTFKEFAVRIPDNFKKTFAISTALFFSGLTGINIYLHPHQNVYFNFAALGYFKPINKQFETDYWGLSYKQALEYLVHTNTEKPGIKIFGQDGPAYWNKNILKKEDRMRLDFKREPAESDYNITNHRWEGVPPASDDKIVYEVRRFGVPVITVYKLR